MKSSKSFTIDSLISSHTDQKVPATPERSWAPQERSHRPGSDPARTRRAADPDRHSPKRIHCTSSLSAVHDRHQPAAVASSSPHHNAWMTTVHHHHQPHPALLPPVFPSSIMTSHPVSEDYRTLVMPRYAKLPSSPFLRTSTPGSMELFPHPDAYPENFYRDTRILDPVLYPWMVGNATAGVGQSPIFPYGFNGEWHLLLLKYIIYLI